MICLVGDILTDVTLSTNSSPSKMRLGGIVHAARGLWAMNVNYAVGYFAPSYLDGQICEYLSHIGCKAIFKIGNVTGCPYTMLIKEAKEIGNQGYEFLYRDCVSIDYDNSALEKLRDYDDLMMISGNYDLSLVLKYTATNQKLHSDVANNVKVVEQLPTGKRMQTLFVSTSSDLFCNTFKGNINDFFSMLTPYAEQIVLKENRGGSRAFDSSNGMIFSVPSQTSIVAHSVGVGDVFDCATIAAPAASFEERLHIASWVSMHYAKTTFCDDFKRSVSSVLKMSASSLKGFVGGCVLPWEVRQKCNIYIAAPDFDFLNTCPIDVLYDSLTYHHFIPRRPVKENGQMPKGATKQERQRLYHGDMKIFRDCNMLVAVLLNNDPGTMIEIGMAVQRGIPAIVYDPYSIADNCMLTESPTLVTSDMDAVISKVFTEYSKKYANGTL